MQKEMGFGKDGRVQGCADLIEFFVENDFFADLVLSGDFGESANEIFWVFVGVELHVLDHYLLESV